MQTCCGVGFVISLVAFVLVVWLLREMNRVMAALDAEDWWYYS